MGLHSTVYASPWQISCYMLTYGDFSIFKMTAILDLLYACSDHRETHLVVFIAMQNVVGIDAE